ncbi:hypothetical protein K503DRAFT_850472 [Rhizopogon vinicolor AM-OR11-026]|uniref:CENP-V/GFA domain-containing protein n=1 Tax=Rhizopogon vinicolor AM-OR11-026 TaxID=1314800 RepID=A0A1B7MXP0_9AGAM|nr:hypothetical protein K503DRAFT_850472 [Rhizopogon vinicolor AM-OR11-026]
MVSPTTNAHPESQTKIGANSSIHHHPPEEPTQQNHSSDKKPIPDTGWRCSPLIPSSDGAHGPDGEELFKTKYGLKHCHCRQCQRLHGAPFQWAVIFPKTISCDVCRAPLFDEGKRVVLAYPSNFKFPPIRARHYGNYGGVPLEFQPSWHVYYGQRVMEVFQNGEDKKNKSELMQEMSDVVGVMPQYKGNVEEPHT